MIRKTSKGVNRVTNKHNTMKEINNVRFMNGIRAVGPVKLNVYVFETDGILIDTGSESLLKNIKQFFATMDVDKILLTHHHEDHSGGAAYVSRTYNVPIYMNEMSIDYCAKRAKYPFYRKFFWGNREPFQAKPLDK